MREIAKGATGRLLAGYYPAAELAGWSVTVADDQQLSDGSWRLTATAVRADPYWSEHADGFTLELDVGRNRWRWNAVQARIHVNSVVVDGRGTPEVV